jgi:hypothetical protein
MYLLLMHLSLVTKRQRMHLVRPFTHMLFERYLHATHELQSGGDANGL